MKKIFSLKYLPINILMIVFSLTTLNFSGEAVPQSSEVCVKAESGDVVCGKTVEKPISSMSSQQPQIFEDISNNITWQLKDCKREKKNTTKVNCILTFILNSTKDDVIKVDLEATDNTFLIDSIGNVYNPSRFIAINRAVSKDALYFVGNIAKNILYKANLEFINIPTATSQVPMLQLKTQKLSGAETKVQFQNISIN